MKSQPRRMEAVWRLTLVLGALALVGAARSRDGPTGDPVRDVDLQQKLGASVPLATPFVDDAGQKVTLGDYFGHGRPVILVLAYYECPMLCTLVMTNLTESLRELSFDPARDFEIVVISIDPTETPALAGMKKNSYLSFYNRPGTAAGWHLLTGQEADIRVVADAVGFRYVYIETTRQYAHPAGIMVLTPGGQISRYFYGTRFRAFDLKLSLTEAGQGAVGSPVDKVLLRCFQYDPMTGRYGFAVILALRIGAVITLAGLGLLIWMLHRKSRAREAAWARGGEASS